MFSCYLASFRAAPNGPERAKNKQHRVGAWGNGNRTKNNLAAWLTLVRDNHHNTYYMIDVLVKKKHTHTHLDMAEQVVEYHCLNFRVRGNITKWVKNPHSMGLTGKLVPGMYVFTCISGA